MEVRIRYFALIREAAGRTEEMWPISSGETAGELFCRLAARYKLELSPSQVLVAVNDAYAPMEKTLSEGDEVVFMPPLAGG